MRISFLILFFSISFLASAQEDTEVTVSGSEKSDYDSLRSYYIKSFPDYFFLYPVIKQRSLDFEMTSLPAKDKLDFKSNRPFSFGLGMYLFEVGVELTFAVPLDEKNKEIYGETDVKDFQINFLGKRWGLDAFHQRYSGFYVVDPSEPHLPDDPYPQRPDIESRNFGLTGNYVFNHHRFSFRSAYIFSERQLKSSGSFLLFSSLSNFKSTGDSAIIGADHEPQFGEAALIKQIKSTIFSIAPGYAYSFIYRGFFINGTLAIGPAHNWLYYQLENGQGKNDIQFSTFVVARIGIGYNGERFFGGLSFVSQDRTAKFEKVQMNSSAGSFKILFGYRFREFGFLKKRAVDLIPFKI